MQDRNLWFSAELNHRPVKGWLLPLFDVEEVLWASEVDGIGILIWHGALKSFMLVEYGIARWIRLSRNQSDEVLWLFLKEDVKGCLVEKFGFGSPRREEERLLDVASKEYIGFYPSLCTMERKLGKISITIGEPWRHPAPGGCH